MKFLSEIPLNDVVWASLAVHCQINLQMKIKSKLPQQKTKHAKCAATKQASTKAHNFLSFINTFENEYEITSKSRFC